MSAQRDDNDITTNVVYDDALGTLVRSFEAICTPFLWGKQHDKDTHRTLAMTIQEIWFLLSMEATRLTLPIHILLHHSWKWVGLDHIAYLNEGGERNHQRSKKVVRSHSRLYESTGPYAVREIMQLAGVEVAQPM